LVTPGDPSSAIVATDPRTGYVRAMASSGGYGQSQFNLAAQGSRQPGSSFKTMVLVTALRQGIDPETTTYNSHPIDLKDTPYGPIKVKTYSNDYGGNENLVTATLHSDNSVYIQLDLDVGPENVKETARMLGVKSKLNGFPAEGLGGLENGVTPLEMSRAYSTLAAGGLRSKQEVIEKVTFPGGKSEDVGKPHHKRVITDGVAYEATKILEQNVQGGTATGVGAYFKCPAAAKTGTTDNFRDAWLVGYTPTLATATWVGYPDAQKSMYNVEGVGQVNGGSLPTQIWAKFMAKAIGNKCKSFPEPKVPFKAEPFSGKYAEEGKQDGAAYDKTKKDYTEGKKKKKTDTGGGGGGGGTTPKEKTPAATPEPAPQAPVDAPGAVAPQ
jgi:penicillin-binding protein 1A